MNAGSSTFSGDLECAPEPIGHIEEAHRPTSGRHLGKFKVPWCLYPSHMDLGAALIKHLVKHYFTVEFIRARQAASRTVKPRCLAFTTVSERSWLPATPYLATCHLFAARQRATYRWGGFSFETTPGVENLGIETGFSDPLWSLCTVHITPSRPET